MALGAGAGTIARMVLARGSGCCSSGIALGLAGAVGGRATAGAAGVERPSLRSRWPSLVVSLILLVAGLQACFWPARRAARIDPIIALRDEEWLVQLNSQSWYSPLLLPVARVQRSCVRLLYRR